MSISYELETISCNVYYKEEERELPETVVIDGIKYILNYLCNLYDKKSTYFSLNPISYYMTNGNIKEKYKTGEKIVKYLNNVLGYNIGTASNCSKVFIKFKYDNLDFLPELTEFAKKQCYCPKSYFDDTRTRIRFYKICIVPKNFFNSELYDEYNFKNKDNFVYINYQYIKLIDEFIEIWNKKLEEKAQANVDKGSTKPPIMTETMNLYKVNYKGDSLFNNKNYLTKTSFNLMYSLNYNQRGEFYSNMSTKEIKEILDRYSPIYTVKKHKNITKEVKFIGIEKKDYIYCEVIPYIYYIDDTHYYVLESEYERVKKYKKEIKPKDESEDEWEAV